MVHTRAARDRVVFTLLLFFFFHTTLGAAPIDRRAMAESVKAEFIHAWDGYKRFAFGHDALKPLSKQPYDWYGQSLLMTPVDALDAMLIMGLDTQAREAERLIMDSLRFDRDISVCNFEVTLRLMGSLLSVYQLTHDARYLALAEDLGRRLLPAFDSPTGLPYRFVNLKTGRTSGSVSNPAETGTLLIEYGMLSRLSGNPVYYRVAKRALVETFNRRSSVGLVGHAIDVETGVWIDTQSHIGGCIDSYYEYLVKAWLLFGDEDCKRMWEESIPAVNRFVAETVRGGLWYGVVDMETGARRSTRFGSLEAFFPAVLALGGDLGRARALQASCYAMWSQYEIEPERYDYARDSVTNAHYYLRPEIVESAYYLYQFTHDEQYQVMACAMFEALKKYCRTNEAYAELKSVITREKADTMESFFFAETLKYFYLLFAPDAVLPFDAVIFTTEAHPMFRMNARLK